MCLLALPLVNLVEPLGISASIPSKQNPVLDATTFSARKFPNQRTDGT